MPIRMEGRRVRCYGGPLDGKVVHVRGPYLYAEEPPDRSLCASPGPATPPPYIERRVVRYQLTRAVVEHQAHTPRGSAVRRSGIPETCYLVEER